MPAIDSDKWPELLRQYANVVRGVFIGVCVDPEGAGISWRRSAHAHTSEPEADDHHGWICFRTERRMAEDDTVKHELAHLLAGPKHGHDDVWRGHLAALHGGVLPRKDRKVPKQASWNCHVGYHGACHGKARTERLAPGRCLCFCHSEK